MTVGRACTTSNRWRLPSCSTSSMAFSSPDELDAAISAANTATQESLAGLKGLEAAIREKKELQRNLLGYIGTKPARDGLKAQKSEKARRAYREQHESDFIIADTAARYFREHGITKLPASKAPAKGD